MSTHNTKWWGVACLVILAVTGANTASATEPRYKVDGTGENATVTDGATGLEWQQLSLGTANSFAAALRLCEESTRGGHDDWRLPNVTELTTLVDDKKTQDPAINTTYFAGFKDSSGYWTSTTARQSLTSAYVVYFATYQTLGRGSVSFKPKTDKNIRVLCTRTGGQ